MTKLEKSVIIINICVFSILSYWNFINIIIWIITYNPLLILIHIISLIVFLFNIYMFKNIIYRKK